MSNIPQIQDDNFEQFQHSLLPVQPLIAALRKALIQTEAEQGIIVNCNIELSPVPPGISRMFRVSYDEPNGESSYNMNPASNTTAQTFPTKSIIIISRD